MSLISTILSKASPAGLITPILPYAAVIAFTVITVMGFYIKYQSSEINTLTRNYAVSENNNKQLNVTITNQNASIQIANEKFNNVQTKLKNVNKLNSKLSTQYRKLRKKIFAVPVPVTCNESTTEMVTNGKRISDKWKK